MWSLILRYLPLAKQSLAWASLAFILSLAGLYAFNLKGELEALKARQSELSLNMASLKSEYERVLKALNTQSKKQNELSQQITRAKISIKDNDEKSAIFNASNIINSRLQILAKPPNSQPHPTASPAFKPTANQPKGGK